MVLAAPTVEVIESEYLDVDVIEEPAGALPVGASAVDELTLFEEPPKRPEDAAEVAEVADVEAPEEVEAVEENVDTAIYQVACRRITGRRGRRHSRTNTSTSSDFIGPRGLQDEAICRSRTRSWPPGGAVYDPAKAAAISGPQVQVPQADAGVHDAG